MIILLNILTFYNRIFVNSGESVTIHGATARDFDANFASNLRKQVTDKKFKKFFKVIAFLFHSGIIRVTEA